MRSAGVPFEGLIEAGYDLPVVALEVRYRQPLSLGMAAVVKTRLAPMKGLRLNWLYEVVTADASGNPQLCLTAQVTLVTVGIRDRKVVRHLPDSVLEIISQILRYLD